MKAKTASALVLIVAALLLLSGCAKIRTSQILSNDNSQVAITLNTGYKTSVVSVNDGKRVTPCISPDVKRKQAPQDENLEVCAPLGNGKLLHKEKYEVEVREGSTCISIWVGHYRYDFCDPPYTLTF